MSAIDKTPPGQSDAICFELEVPHRPEKVWRALTDPALLSEWLLPVIGFHLAPGTAFTFTAPAQPGWDGTVRCRMLESDPPKQLRWAWVVGGLDTVVTFTLTPTAGGTRLSIVQSGFQPTQKQNFGGARYGWTMMSGKLLALIARMP